jgi:hypothetical protein
MTLFSTANFKRIVWGVAAFIGMAVVAAMLAGSGTATAKTSAMANNCDVIIYEYGHNAPGPDTPAKANYEFLRLVNRGPAAVNVENWWVQDDFPHVYKLKGVNLPAGSPFRDTHATADPADDTFQIPAGHSVYLYNGTGTDTNPTNNSAAIYRNAGHHFNNGGDTLSLKDKDGKTQSYVQYTSYREKIGPLSCS